ncbi:MAG TPA: hypothetical protein VF081_06575 [Solirubrobacterales bacterium]
MKKSKFGVAMLAAFALMAVSASGAQATNWTAASYKALISGEQSSPSSTSFGFEDSTTAKCVKVGLAGELTAASSSLTLSPGYTECTAFGFSEATITPNECTFTLKATSGSVDTFSGSGEIKCPEGKKIVVVGGNCEVKIGAQSIGTVSYKTVTASEPDEIEATLSTSAITYEKSKDGISCPLTGTGSKSTGTLTGTIKLKAGKEDTTPINIGMS